MNIGNNLRKHLTLITVLMELTFKSKYNMKLKILVQKCKTAMGWTAPKFRQSLSLDLEEEKTVGIGSSNSITLQRILMVLIVNG